MFYFCPRDGGARRMRSPVAFSIGATMVFAGVAYAQHDHAMSVAPQTLSASATTPSAPPIALGAPVPLRFDSVLSRYKPMTDQKLGSWREANDTVTRIGGWRTYLKEAQAPEVMPPSVPSIPTTPTNAPTPVAPNPHAGHGAKP